MQKGEHMENLVSVIIPVYNRQEYIEECLQSVFNQTHGNFEIILVDDGSTDDSLKICREYAQKDPRVKVFTGNHGGVSAARNIALANAGGEYVFFLDSDDVIHPKLLEVFVASMKENDAQIAGTAVINVLEEHWENVREKIRNFDNDVGATVKIEHEKAVEVMLNKHSPIGCVGGVMIRRDLIGETAFRTDLQIGEDFYFIYENLIKGACAVFLKQKWYYVRIHGNNSSWNWGYGGFWTRFYRRKLVWQQEESFGRKRNANGQKGSAFGCFLLCAQRVKPYSADARKMRKVLRQHAGEICPALPLKRKIVYWICCYCPLTTKLMLLLKGKFSKKQRSINDN